ncbi:MAG: CDP-alcohol phosphatidyltransferase family protein [Thermoleophilia bacterium]|nr:CDP-alcohol phosphatidyltransferase family protein [Thermoleophilia bacterium]
MTTPEQPGPPRRPHPLRWLPNALTVGRLAALPVLVWVLAAADGPTSATAAWLFAGVAVTDFIDGKLARAWHAETTFGRLADPFADRMLVAVGLIGLILLDRMHPAGPVIVLVRDVGTIGAVVAFRRSGLDMRVDMLGKTSSSLVMAAIALALLSTAAWIDWLFWAGVVLSLVAFANYARTAARQLRAAPPSTPA